MSYLLDKKNKRKKITRLLIGVILFLILIYFREPVFGGLSALTGTAFAPVINFGQNIGERIGSIGTLFSSKQALTLENENLHREASEIRAGMENYNALLEENLMLKEIMRRTGSEATMVLSTILAKPGQSIYGTLLIDAGEKQGVNVGDLVLALGDIPLGRIAEVNSSTSKVVLFTNPGERTEAEIGGVYFPLIGRGGGNFELETPRDYTLEKGQHAILPGISPRVVARLEGVITDPRRAFQVALLVSPVNIQQIKFVQVEIR
ncbi:MAG TPA: rod shape-determining protein MreC [Candidatus Paceibacterota bacterium]|nr:rod shape-determining protein MreC [Candidatus Paceibacterota bacterium]